MFEQDRAEFAALLTATMDVYHREIKGPVIRVYWSALERFELETVRMALSAWVQNPDHGQFPPKPADLIRMIEGTTGDRALLAWSKVDKAIRQVGHYESVAFDDPIIHRVIDDMGGWRRLAAHASDKELEFTAKDFANRYRVFALRGVPDYPAYLIGEAEAFNSHKGHQQRHRVMLLGNQARAQEVMRLGGSGGTLRVGGASVTKMLERFVNHDLSRTDENGQAGAQVSRRRNDHGQGGA